MIDFLKLFLPHYSEVFWESCRVSLELWWIWTIFLFLMFIIYKINKIRKKIEEEMDGDDFES